jgi:pyridoxal 5'-phosphate synthase pdxT subunit
VDVLATYVGKPALVQRANIMAATFHPELTEDSSVHERFVKMAVERPAQDFAAAKT